MTSLAIATMTRALDTSAAVSQREALRELVRQRLPIFIADRGSIPEFVREISRFPGVHVQAEGNTLVQQVRWSLTRAASEYERVVYTEPDKRDFFRKGLDGLVRRACDSELPIVAARDDASFATYPTGMRSTESAFNQLAARLLDSPLTDLLYGPIALPAAAIGEYLPDVPDDLAWGWRTYVLARSIRANRPVASYTGPFPCPADQASEDLTDHRAYRLQQLGQNVEGLRLAILASTRATVSSCPPE